MHSASPAQRALKPLLGSDPRDCIETISLTLCVENDKSEQAQGAKHTRSCCLLRGLSPLRPVAMCVAPMCSSAVPPMRVSDLLDGPLMVCSCTAKQSCDSSRLQHGSVAGRLSKCCC